MDTDTDTDFTTDLRPLDGDGEGVEQEPTEVDAPTSDGSILGDLRQMRERKAQEAPPTFDLEVPGYGVPSRVVIRYRYPKAGYKVAVKAGETEFGSKSPDAKIDGNSDLLIACCGSVIGRTADGTLIDLRTERPLGENEIPDPPMQLGKDVAEAFRIEVPDEVERKSRFIVRHLFSPRAERTGAYDGDVALIAAGNAVYRWLAGAAASLDDDFAGE